MSRSLLPLALLTLLTAAPTRAAVTQWTGITVRVYDTTDARVDGRQPSLDVAASIVSATSVEVTWRVCGPGSKGEIERAPGRNVCAAPMRDGELAVRIVHSGTPLGRKRDVPLGDALIDTRVRSGVLATIYEDRVQWLAAQTGADPLVLLGRAIAHELGHLLLASNAHALGGLMRPIWSQEEIRRNQVSDWAFAPEEATLIRARLARRDVTAPATIERGTLAQKP